jgi:hypothetical protein
MSCTACLLVLPRASATQLVLLSSLWWLQVWPDSEQARTVRPWHGPPLLTDKVVKLLR